jgi:hypothetical protein
LYILTFLSLPPTTKEFPVGEDLIQWISPSGIV